MHIVTFVVVVLVLLMTGGWGMWIRPLPTTPAWYGGSLLWFVIILIMILWLLGVPMPMIIHG